MAVGWRDMDIAWMPMYRWSCSLSWSRGGEGGQGNREKSFIYKNASVYQSIWGRGPKLGHKSFTPLRRR
eukprot:1839251-Prymnesium_polylepis.1